MTTSNSPRTALTLDDVASVSPALENFTKTTIVSELWSRPDLSPRDRAVVTIAALVARNQTIGMQHYFTKALDSGVTPPEISEIITHLAFYCGWGNAFFAVEVVKDIFAERGRSGSGNLHIGDKWNFCLTSA
ncbi:carboxymuconolactone decarboxylase family protein [Rhizobium sp. 18055]|uniref:carboxymuconolactone decarboxylase family protein n=1 Tax=Rhizobium sp. 18055 TaxID=2681403 RepID=UPI00135888A3|nr:carboxymuconolactone decarboxylase family protein [Rhizobium sp. 18055]